MPCFYKINQAEYPHVAALYLKERYRFPIIGSVIEATQEGEAYTLKGYEKMVYFVMHKFGNAQIVGAPDAEFISCLVDWIFCEKAFPYPKLRLLTADPLVDFAPYAVLSTRAQLCLQEDWLSARVFSQSVFVEPVTKNNVEELNSTFKVDLFNRFWGSKNDFLKNGLGFVLLYDGKPASLCYSAAIWNDVAEIDVVTLERFRKLELAKKVCSHFISDCLSRGLKPSWDCFTNNIGSVKLAESLGFLQILQNYSLYTFGKEQS